MSFKIGEKIRNLSTKKFRLVDQLSELTHIGTNTSNKNISHFDLTPIVAKTIYPKTITLPMELTKQTKNRKRVHTRGSVVIPIIVRLITDQL